MLGMSRNAGGTPPSEGTTNPPRWSRSKNEDNSDDDEELEALIRFIYGDAPLFDRFVSSVAPEPPSTKSQLRRSIDELNSTKDAGIERSIGLIAGTNFAKGSHQIGVLSDHKKLICLVSKGCHDRQQSANQSRVLDWLTSRKVPHTIVDGMDLDQREKRDKLFEISGVRGNYPQFFFELRDGHISFFGNFNKIDELNETSGLPPDLLAQHHGLETWEKVFGCVVESFD